MAITDVDPLVFVSYRRSDAAGHARALYRDLQAKHDELSRTLRPWFG